MPLRQMPLLPADEDLFSEVPPGGAVRGEEGVADLANPAERRLSSASCVQETFPDLHFPLEVIPVAFNHVLLGLGQGPDDLEAELATDRCGVDLQHVPLREAQHLSLCDVIIDLFVHLGGPLVGGALGISPRRGREDRLLHLVLVLRPLARWRLRFLLLSPTAEALVLIHWAFSQDILPSEGDLWRGAGLEDSSLHNLEKGGRLLFFESLQFGSVAACAADITLEVRSR
mmetsp:Transcript_19499/g.48777  ORF Transcript_19499/g.48777 Transcript_19499/m.48777 type:complete len:229 (-) Transcript_19499:379-1065(-)